MQRKKKNLSWKIWNNLLTGFSGKAQLFETKFKALKIISGMKKGT